MEAAMKAFLAALVFFAAVAAVTGVLFESINLTATEAYSLESARPGHDGDVEHRPGFAPDVAAD